MILEIMHPDAPFISIVDAEGNKIGMVQKVDLEKKIVWMVERNKFGAPIYEVVDGVRIPKITATPMDVKVIDIRTGKEYIPREIINEKSEEKKDTK